ncbi:hypothetical protein NL676_026112 [Syzygium grande]|nr:hypothetical protein NL676_026112 [Syzygium grande]
MGRRCAGGETEEDSGCLRARACAWKRLFKDDKRSKRSRGNLSEQSFAPCPSRWPRLSFAMFEWLAASASCGVTLL